MHEVNWYGWGLKILEDDPQLFLAHRTGDLVRQKIGDADAGDGCVDGCLRGVDMQPAQRRYQLCLPSARLEHPRVPGRDCGERDGLVLGEIVRCLRRAVCREI